MSNEARLPKEVQAKIDRVDELQKLMYEAPASVTPQLEANQSVEPTPAETPKPQEPAAEKPEAQEKKDELPAPSISEEKMEMPDAIADGEDLSKRLEKELARNRTAIGRLNKAQTDLAKAQTLIKDLESRAAPSENVEVKKLSEHVATLTAKLAQVSTAPPAQPQPVVSEPAHIAKFRTEFGDDAADAILLQWRENEQLKSQLSGVNNSVSELKATNKTAAEHDKRVSDLAQKLSADGIDFNVLNNDSGFNSWLDYKDPKHGDESYRDIMLRNLDSGNIDATAAFFAEYHLATQNHVPQTPAPAATPKPSLDEHVTQQPNPTGNTSHIESTPAYSAAQIDQFYANYAQAQREARSTGDYSKVDAMALEEKKIEAALLTR